MKASPQDQIRATSLEIGALLGDNKRYIMLESQRWYSWKEKQITQLIGDVKALYEETGRKKTRQYFFGPMVFVQNDTKHIIIDGQQRLATIGVLLGVMRDMLIDGGNRRKANAIQNALQINEQVGEAIGRISLSSKNNEFYRQCVINSGSAKDKNEALSITYKNKHEPNYWLAYAYQEFYQKLKKDMRVKTTREYSKLLNVVLKKFVVVKIEIDELDLAFKIFETINERGQPLDVSDLLKNYILVNCEKNKRDEITGVWERMINEVGKKHANVYLRYFWIANHDIVSKYDLYKHVTENLEINLRPRIRKYVKELRQQAEIFSALCNPKKNDVWWNDDELVKTLQNLNLLESEIVRVVLLIARVHTKNKKTYKSLAKMLLCFFFRSKVICNAHATALEKTMSVIAKNIRLAKKIDLYKIEKILKEDKAYPSDEMFQSMFISQKLRSKVQKYALLQLELKHDPNSDVEPLSNITVEHVMPQKLNASWKERISTIEHRNLLNSFGNLVLLKDSKNKNLGNKSWEIKSRTYKKSQIRITREVGEKTEWNEKEIKSRSGELARAGLEIWKVGK